MPRKKTTQTPQSRLDQEIARMEDLMLTATDALENVAEQFSEVLDAVKGLIRANDE